MVKIIDMGLTPAQDPQFGISYSNIADEITEKNWKKKAVVRDSKYLWIKKGSYKVDNKKIHRYFIGVYPDRNSIPNEYEDLKDAISFVNTYSDSEGTYPDEFENGWEIRVIRK